MPYRREDAPYLFRKSLQLRAAATELRGEDPEVSAKLLGLAAELESYAEHMEQRPDPTKVH